MKLIRGSLNSKRKNWKLFQTTLNCFTNCGVYEKNLPRL